MLSPLEPIFTPVVPSIPRHTTALPGPPLSLASQLVGMAPAVMYSLRGSPWKLT
jgi:hypothetical protein